MQFDTNNNAVKLCAQGMEIEGGGDKVEAQKLFMQAWNEAKDDFEKFIAAHYVARNQKTIEGKLEWDELALKLAIKITDYNINQSLPSLYLNIAKGYEDLKDYKKAFENYQMALQFIGFLPDSGYGNMIRLGIDAGILRISKSQNIYRL